MVDNLLFQSLCRFIKRTVKYFQLGVLMNRLHQWQKILLEAIHSSLQIALNVLF